MRLERQPQFHIANLDHVDDLFIDHILDLNADARMASAECFEDGWQQVSGK